MSARERAYGVVDAPRRRGRHRLRSGYLAVEDAGEFRPGFAAPILNVNGFSYVPFLEALGLRDEYASQFGGTPRACTGIPIQRQGPAAAWVWRHSVPVDAVARRF